jgi:hypothetical protein
MCSTSTEDFVSTQASGGGNVMILKIVVAKNWQSFFITTSKTENNCYHDIDTWKRLEYIYIPTYVYVAYIVRF